MDPQYRAAYAQTEAAALSLLVDVMAQSSAAQRLKLTQKIDKVRSDFQALKCLKARSLDASLPSEPQAHANYPAQLVNVLVFVRAYCAV